MYGEWKGFSQSSSKLTAPSSLVCTLSAQTWGGGAPAMQTLYMMLAFDNITLVPALKQIWLVTKYSALSSQANLTP